MAIATCFTRVGNHRGSPRLWIEGARLAQAGFSPGTPINFIPLGTGFSITPGILGENTISHRRSASSPLGRRPVLDVNNRSILAAIADYQEVKVHVSFGRLIVCPSIRATHIRRQIKSGPPWSVLELFAGGGTLSQAFHDHSCFRMVAAAEINPDYSDEYSARFPDVEILAGDINHIHPSEYPFFSILAAGIPCTDFSRLGRHAKKTNAVIPELGSTGSLFLPVLNLVEQRYPLACVFEQVPEFRASAAGAIFVKRLKEIGYSVSEMTLDPVAEWGEPCSRKRWICVATLSPGFTIVSPKTPFSGNIGDYLDEPNDDLDRSDCERIAATVAGLTSHAARKQAEGCNFKFKVIDRNSSSVPIITKSYHKTNLGGCFVSTAHGYRRLRQSEIERLHDVVLHTRHYATAVEILGQGVLRRPLSAILQQLKTFLLQHHA